MDRLELDDVSRLAGEVLDEVEVAVVGKRKALTLVLAAILAGGHVLLEDFPGLGKTLAARSFAQTLGLNFARAQFTPDLLPVRSHRIVRLRPAVERVLVPSRTAVHRAPARRRDQPHAAADAGRAAGGDAGATDHGRGPDVRARAAVPRAGDGEPDRVRGHVSAPGGAARPVHDAHELRLPVGRRGVGRAAATHGSAARGAVAAPDHRRRRRCSRCRPRSNV